LAGVCPQKIPDLKLLKRNYLKAKKLQMNEKRRIYSGVLLFAAE
jgi:hypothetical protein